MTPPRDLNSLVSDLRQEPLPAQLFTTPLVHTLKLPDNPLLHRPPRHVVGTSTSCATVSSTASLTQQIRTLTQLESSTLCPKCFAGPGLAEFVSMHHSYTPHPAPFPTLECLSFLAHQNDLNRRLHRHHRILTTTPSRSPAPTLARLLSAAESHLLRSFFYQGTYPELTASLDQFATTVADLGHAVRLSTTHRHELLDRLRLDGAPSWWDSPTPPEPSDTTVCLMACSRHPHFTKQEVIANQVVRAFTIFSDRCRLVLCLPRYAADYLLGRADFHSLYVCITPAPPHPSINETAIGLWEPSSTGPLQDMVVALRTAATLCPTSSLPGPLPPQRNGVTHDSSSPLS